MPRRPIFILWYINQEQVDPEFWLANLCGASRVRWWLITKKFHQNTLDQTCRNMDLMFKSTYFRQEWQCQSLDPHQLHRHREAGAPGGAPLPADIRWKPWWCGGCWWCHQIPKIRHTFCKCVACQNTRTGIARHGRQSIEKQDHRRENSSVVKRKHSCIF